ncbi:MAG: class I SAM-dependent methyltransferase [Aureibaculum sp.]|nr:class I SAM-dependent methyltransferase [Aureibaculum sp.]
MERFDTKAKEWDNNPDKSKRAKTFAIEIGDYIKPNKTKNALEFGCGTGLLSFELKDAFKTIALVDTSEGMIDVLKDKIEKQGIKNFKPLLADLLKENTDITDIDVIYTLMTMHHINDLDKAFRVFKNVINTNGYLCIADLVEEDGSFHAPELNFDGHNGFNKKELSTKLAGYGFIMEYYSIPHTIEKQQDTGIKKYPLFLMIAKKV